MKALSSDKKLCKLLDSTKIILEVNRKTVIDIFYDAVKLIYYKQSHMKKNQLKSKEIARCLNLIYYHQLYSKIIQVNGELAENMGKPFLEEDALNYYQHRVMGKVRDKLGQEVVIDEMGMDFLYEGHNVDPVNYRQARGKRLPWIRHTIQNTNEIYIKQEGNSLLYIYVSKFIIPIPFDTVTDWFLVLCRKRKDVEKTLAFLTAIPVARYNGFLSKLESMSPVMRGT
ncbi:MAG: hypothetical protein WBE75_08170 [Candidatus Omnitrophota bacterium]